ncbi:hypothetical protein, partial [Bradyrhizobium sp. NBAIM08]|uniref:hypothetical protein n=1 Tax=Bradyrhizobium sp. NBAIM08 TaxID=2793815 RepID=UPI001CD5FC39
TTSLRRGRLSTPPDCDDCARSVMIRPVGSRNSGLWVPLIDDPRDHHGTMGPLFGLMIVAKRLPAVR